MPNNDILSGFHQTPNGNITPIDQVAEDSEDSPMRAAGSAIHNDMNNLGNGLVQL